YEMRPEFLRAAKANVDKAGFGSLVTFHNKDPTEGFDETGVDAVVVDLGDPWRMVRAAYGALVGGGLLAGFTPTINQLEKLAIALREGGFVILEAVELLMREFKTEAGKVRPETRMIGHTAYVTIARKLLPTPEALIIYIRDYSRNDPAVGAITTGTKTTIAGTEIHDILRGLMVVIAGALIILPAYINYESWHRLNLDITFSMSISLTSFALGILIFILVVGKKRIEGTKKP